MNKDLTSWLVCLNCASQLSLASDREANDRVISGRLICRQCGQKFAVVGGVPRMIASRDSADPSFLTAERFGYEWHQFNENYDFYKDQFLDWIHPVTPDFFKNKLVLDAGCGKGKHVVISESFGAQAVIGIDYGNSVDAAVPYLAKHAKNPSRTHVVQADIRRLPFKEIFDYAYCIGVLHHLPDPKEGFLKLLKVLKPGGALSIWVYGHEGNWLVRLLVDPIRKHLTSKLPVKLLMALAFLVSLPAFATARYLYRPIHKSLPRLYKNLPMATYLTMWFPLPFKEIWNIIYDQLVTPITHYIARPMLEQWVAEAKVRDYSISQRLNNGWRMFVTK